VPGIEPGPLGFHQDGTPSSWLEDNRSTSAHRKCWRTAKWSGSQDSHPQGCPSLGRPDRPFPGDPVARKWCLRRESHSHWLVSETSASAVGLPRHRKWPAEPTCPAIAKRRRKPGRRTARLRTDVLRRGSLRYPLRWWRRLACRAEAQGAKAGGPRGSFALNLRGKNPLLWTLSYRPMVASEGFAPWLPKW
jgi:hypothetical protein